MHTVETFEPNPQPAPEAPLQTRQRDGKFARFLSRLEQAASTLRKKSARVEYGETKDE